MVVMAVKNKGETRDASGAWTVIRKQLSSLGGELERLQEHLSEAEQAADRIASDPEAVTVQELAARHHLDTSVIVEFARTMGEVLQAAGHDTEVELDAEAARRAALLAVAEFVWQGELGALLDSAQTRELLGVSRQRVHELASRRRLIALRERSGRLRFPAFQFHDGESPHPDLVGAFWALSEHASGWTAASWLTTSHSALDDDSPLVWLRRGGDPERVRALAARDAERLAH